MTVCHEDTSYIYDPRYILGPEHSPRSSHSLTLLSYGDAKGSLCYQFRKGVQVLGVMQKEFDSACM